MGVGAGLYMRDVVKKFTLAISSPDEFLLQHSNMPEIIENDFCALNSSYSTPSVLYSYIREGPHIFSERGPA